MRQLVVIAGVAMAACVPTPAAKTSEAGGPIAEASPPISDPAPPGLRACDAAAIQAMVGQRATPALESQAMTRAGARTVRRYNTGDPVTMDYRTDRLNMETDASGRIVALRCG